MIVGRSTPGSTPFTMAADTKLVTRFQFVGPTRLPKLTVYLDGLGGGVGSQVVRGIVYDSSDALLASGDQISVAAGQAAGWVDLTFKQTPGGVLLPSSGYYDIGIHVGAATNVIRVFS